MEGENSWRSLWLSMLFAALPLLLACGGDDEEPEAALRAVPILTQVAFTSPVEVGQYPDGRLYVAERTGLVRLFDLGGSGEGETLLDIRDKTDDQRGEGLLSFVLDPEFEANRYVWAYYYTAGADQTLLSRFQVEGGVADPSSELMILRLDQPGTNQNGGAIRFGPDEMLYLSLGDGSASFDPFDNGQNLATLLATVIRIDVSEASPGSPYAVPTDNPFRGVEGAQPEIWAYGFRNPWRIAFDSVTGQLWGTDVGASDAEEVNNISGGGNYGWSVREGFECLAGASDCKSEGLIDPVTAYAHSEGRCAAIGGVVYRGSQLPELDGSFLFGDYCTGEVFAIELDCDCDPHAVAAVPGALNSFGTDSLGNVFITTEDAGVWQLVAE